MTQAVFNFAAHGQRADRAPTLRRVPPAPAPGGAAPHAGGPADPGEAIGFDHARFGLVPPAPCLWPGHPVREGWERGRRLVGRRTRPATLSVRRWLGLRLAAWTRDEAFDDHQITPQVLRSLETAAACPVSGRALGEDAEVLPADAARGWVAGNLVLLSPEVAALWRTLDLEGARAALVRAEAAEEPGTPMEGLSLRHWRRLVTLKSLATPLPHAEATRIPLHALPPNRLRLVNPIQELQVLLTLQLATPGWGTRARLVAESLPQALRGDFNLFFHSLLAQALRVTAGPARAEMREALASAWGDAIVQRRWLRLADHVDAALAARLVDRLVHEPLPGLVVVRHDAAASE